MMRHGGSGGARPVESRRSRRGKVRYGWVRFCYGKARRSRFGWVS